LIASLNDEERSHGRHFPPEDVPYCGCHWLCQCFATTQFRTGKASGTQNVCLLTLPLGGAAGEATLRF
jgi:hypothetical protein